ncbi:hypothetical protein DdX_09920 [Ditylenchus destructor]|uniref:ditrans,polycis-polyprenyl diphosphate synthase [(2E,6E)-farnesyldiphosphate specific] n=1 Tax=Ditylenchus destructor TaxID=166010 RepID=A0AAD4N120_9BILA|nr:hypothetical protein DdX_09920 [Ditylenchus destructor]
MVTDTLKASLSYFFQFVIWVIFVLSKDLRIFTTRLIRGTYKWYKSAACLDGHVQQKELKARKISRPKAVPRHLAVMFLDPPVINFKLIAHLVKYSDEYNIKCISLYDPWSIIHSNQCKLSRYLTKNNRLQTKISDECSEKHPRINGDVTLQENGIKVILLGDMHGKQSLVNACKALSTAKSEIIPQDVTEALSEEMIFEPDFLVKIGPPHFCLAGYPPFSLRVAEMCEVQRFESTDSIQENEFCSLLERYLCRDRRLGR